MKALPFVRLAAVLRIGCMSSSGECPVGRTEQKGLGSRRGGSLREPRGVPLWPMEGGWP